MVVSPRFTSLVSRQLFGDELYVFCVALTVTYVWHYMREGAFYEEGRQ